MTTALEFFRKKRQWSRYKDLILDYYLEPYLAKVAVLRRPILVVDCFAGPGRFDDGQAGSPLIISKRLQHIQERGVKVLGFYVERDPVLFERLRGNTQDSTVPVQIRPGDFREHVDEISGLARDHTVFVYLDPIRPSDLLFADMESVYAQLEEGHSVEVLVNFMSTSFLRAVRALTSQIPLESSLPHERESIPRWDAVAGGTYWQEIVSDDRASNAERIERIAEGYARKLRRWFNWVLSYPIRAKYEHKFPRYHLMFGSRHPDAIELMNRAMVKARRQFIQDRFVDGFLFSNEPEIEVINPAKIEKVIVEACRVLGRAKWTDLRVAATMTNPCMYTDSEFNAAIKRLIQKGDLKSDCSGKTIAERAWVWSAQ